MTTYVAVLRGINVGGHGKVPMGELRKVCEAIGFADVRTYIQSGNVVFRTDIEDAEERLSAEILRVFGVKTFTVLRTVEELREIVQGNPFPAVEPTKLVVSFLQKEPVSGLDGIATEPEEVKVSGRNMYIHFPVGQGNSKFPMAKVERALGTAGTARNWNSVLALLRMAEEI